MATEGGLRRLVYMPNPSLTPSGERQPQGQQDSGGGLWLLFPLVTVFVVACIIFFDTICDCKKTEELETTGGHGHDGGGEDRRRARWQRQQQQRQAAAAVPEVVVDVDKLSGQQAEPAALECTYRAAEGTCSVCLAELQDGEPVRMLMPCMHYFHAACINKWLRKNATCPICRAQTL